MKREQEQGVRARREGAVIARKIAAAVRVAYAPDGWRRRGRRATAGPSPEQLSLGPEHRIVDDAAELACILDPLVNICVWQRSLRPEIIEYCYEARAGRSGSVERFAAVDGLDIEDLLAPLPRGRGRAELRADIQALVARYAALVGCKRVKASLEVVETDSCRKFHADLVGVRLLCTYAGPGTQWVPNASARREMLSQPRLAFEAANQAIAPKQEAVRQVATGDVALLKGEAWPGNRGNGIIHRSPPIEREGERRLLLTLDSQIPGMSG
jgi:hypothetical protein